MQHHHQSWTVQKYYSYATPLSQHWHELAFTATPSKNNTTLNVVFEALLWAVNCSSME
jgi:hypothetical protein